MFALEMTLLTGRYVATRYNDRRRAEWPPHPARLYSALVEAYAADGQKENERAALEWLEALPPPEIVASAQSEREPFTVFVPVNDETVIGNFEDEIERLRELELAVANTRERAADGGGEAKKSPQKAEKQAAQARAKLSELLKKKVAVPEKIGKTDPDRAASLLPEGRMKQPRSFPSVRPESPKVTFVWPDAEPQTHGATLDRVAARVMRIGHSSSLVSLRVVTDVQASSWVPVEQGGEPFRVVRAGQLERLQKAFLQHRETEPRVLPRSFVGYQPPLPPDSREHSTSVFGQDWIVLEVEGRSPFAARIPDFTRALRAALMKHAEQPVREVLSGHRADGSLSEQPHLAFLGLPFVGHHRHADGLVKGFALILPRACTADDKVHVYRALAAWERSVRRTKDLDSDAPPLLSLYAGTSGDVGLRRIDGPAELRTLDPRSWSGPATRHWVSVTPIALDRNPGDLRSRDAARLNQALTEAEDIVAVACERIGLPRPTRVEILPSVPLVGALKAGAFGPFPREPGRAQRVLTHARLEFPESVEGPILLGAGRYQGLGLFRPLGETEC
jgi:CRISPR-associated protein Csb2